jgi:hypothetical protein
MGDKFPKHVYHSIVCIAALIAHQASQIEVSMARRKSSLDKVFGTHNRIL